MSSSTSSAPSRSRPSSGDPDRAEQRVGHLERRRARRCRSRRAGGCRRGRGSPPPLRRSRPAASRSCASTSAGIAVGLRAAPSPRGRRRSSSARSSSSEPPADTAAGPRSSPRSSACGTPVQAPDVREEVTGRDHRPGGEAHVLVDHRRVVVVAAREVRRPARRRRASRDRRPGARGAWRWPPACAPRPTPAAARATASLRAPLRRAGTAGGSPPSGAGRTWLYAKPLTYALWRPSSSSP